MNLSYLWLRELVPFDLSPAELARGLTRAGCCVEELRACGPDTTLVAEVTTNRPDWLCHWGVAREIAAFTGLPFRAPAIELPAPGPERIQNLTSVTVEAPELCPRYTARLIRNLKVGPSPAWLAARLETVGLKPRNNVVDITNLVLFETNQPLHAFDFDLLAGQCIVVRRAWPEEAFTSVFGEERRLRESMCVIADAKRTVALAGVKGGLGTAVHEGTSSVLLEAAYFPPAATRRTSRAAQLESDSSYRFERGIDPGGVERASARAAQLLCELAGGTLVDGIIDTAPDLARPAAVTMRWERCARLLGAEPPRPETERIFAGLGFRTLRQDAISITVEAPTFRQDVTREIDLIEEVARCRGYETIPETLDLRLSAGAVSRATADARAARETLVGLGYHECLTDSFVEERWTREIAPLGAPAAAAAARVRNPVREDRPCLRRSLLPGLLEVRRVNRLDETAAVFELNRVFLPRPDGTVEEPLRLAIVDDRGETWVRGALESWLAGLRVESKLTVEPLADALPGYRAGTAAEIRADGERIALFGLANETATEAHDLLRAPGLLEADAGRIAALPRRALAFRPLPRFPAVARDIALVVPETVLWRQIEAAVRERPESVESIAFTSLYRGKQLPAGRKSIAFSILYRRADRSLTDEEANALRDEMVKHLTARIPDSALR